MILDQVGIVGTLVALRRFRHLLVLLGALLQASSLASVVSGLALRPRPDGVEILGEWRDSALPSRPVAWLSASLVGLGYVLLPAGRMRNRVKLASAGLVGLFVLAQLYLAVDHPTDIVVSVVLGFSIPVLFFRLLVPNDAYPVVYALHRQTAHLDVTGARGEAIRRAAREQLGLLVVSVESFGLGGSAGSTPLRLRLDGESPTYVFAKLYARNHLRADRWFKLGRSVLYGSLEDEAPFETVRRLVQYEDYLLRLMRDVGLPTPTPYGVVAGQVDGPGRHSTGGQWSDAGHRPALRK